MALENGRHEDQAVDEIGVLDRGSKADGPAQGKAHDRGALEPEAADEGRDIVGHGLESHRPVGGRRATMRLEIDTDDTTTRCEELHIGSEHLNGPETAMQENKRVALTNQLVAELDPVNTGSAGSVGWHHHPLC